MSSTTHSSDNMHEAKNLLNKSAHDSAEWLKHKGTAAAETAKKAVSTVNDSVHQHPWSYIGGAAVGALVLGFLLGRRR